MPPPPPPSSEPTPPPAWGQQPGAPSYGQPPAAPPAYDLGVATKPPRPKVQIGGILTMVGGVLLVVGAVLPWLKGGGETANGLDDYLYRSNGDLTSAQAPGSTWIFAGLVLFGLGLALYLAGRVLAVAIIAIVMAGLALVFVLGGWAIISDVKDSGDGVSFGIGVPAGTIGMALTLVGSIMATSKRRRVR